MRIVHLLAIAALGGVLTVSLGCGDDDDDGVTTSPTEAAEASPEELSGEATVVAVSLGEFFVIPEPTSVPAGTVTFDVTNDSPSPRIGHEMIVIRSNLPLDDLPVTSTGAVDEAAEGIEIAARVTKLSPGNSRELTVVLEAGKYGLVCNLYVEDQRESHYQRSQWSEFIVE
jgi:uncharacterized cupredoxin-like copper-binding protein